jgi:hypothetical protein
MSRQLAARMPATGALPAAATLTAIDAALDLFIQYAIGRMVPIGRMLAAAFPHPA